MTSEHIDMLNKGHGITYELVPVRPDRPPVIGEIRYTVPLVPSPAEPLAAMIPLDPVRIIWDGRQWIGAGEKK